MKVQKLLRAFFPCQKIFKISSSKLKRRAWQIVQNATNVGKKPPALIRSIFFWAYTCTTSSSGSNCRTCLSQTSRTTDNHCDTCNSGYYNSGTGCTGKQDYLCMWFQNERWRCFFRSKMWVFIPPPKKKKKTKMTKFTFYTIYLLFSWCYQSKKVFGKTKVFLLWEKNNFFFLMGNQKWQKKFDFENLKIPQNVQISVCFEKTNFLSLFTAVFFDCFPKIVKKWRKHTFWGL